MIKETAGAFLERTCGNYSDAGQFNVYKVEQNLKGVTSPPLRRDFYKISLVCNSEGLLTYADKVIHVKKNAVIFGNPMVPYSWTGISDVQKGYFCLFTEDFANHQLKTDSLSESPLFRVNGNPVMFPDDASMELLKRIFDQMLKEFESPYINKHELLKSYVQIIMHEALKIHPDEFSSPGTSSSARLTDLFFELLERQFPIVSPQQVMQLKNAGEFADHMSIHTNHLNKTLKEITGKTTSEHISDRMIIEAKALLIHSSWNVAEIGYSLGFGHPSNFNIFFKRQTGKTPYHFRKEAVPIHNF